MQEHERQVGIDSTLRKFLNDPTFLNVVAGMEKITGQVMLLVPQANGFYDDPWVTISTFRDGRGHITVHRHVPYLYTLQTRDVNRAYPQFTDFITEGTAIVSMEGSRLLALQYNQPLFREQTSEEILERVADQMNAFNK